MLFNDFAFFHFLVAVLVVLRLLERLPRFQKGFLLLASNFFYGSWDYRFLGLLWISIFVDYFVGRALKAATRSGRRKVLLATSIVTNLTILGFFKYFDFFQDGMANLLQGWGIPFSPVLLGIILPVGISFYTFQSLSYSIDVYRKKIEPCRSLLDFAQFVSYFPQLVAGPIERAGRLLPQLRKPIAIRMENLMSGGLLIIWGLFKKVVAADFAGTYLVDNLFPNPEYGSVLWLAAIAFGFQIFLDFSGYCDIARGTSRCMGIELMENFHAPYFAPNITEFWRRWHISLSSWFRDYLYIPLGGNRLGSRRTYVNLAVTMLLCGLWHGAAMSFVLWGMFHGAMLMIHRAMGLRDQSGSKKTVLTVAGWALCFVLVTFGWMLFRVESFNLTRNVALMFSPGDFLPNNAAKVTSLLLSLAVVGLVVVAAHFVQIAARKGRQLENLLPPFLTGAVFGILLLLVFLVGSLRESIQFIYFQF